MSWSNIHKYVNGQAAGFSHMLRQVEEIQKSYLKDLLDFNKNTEFGIVHKFSWIRSIDDFQKEIPVQTYSDVKNDIQRMMREEDNILCSEPVMSFERTGGSGGGNKFIPYTYLSIKSFQSALYPWLDDLLTKRPGITRGSLYWSISPSIKDELYASKKKSEKLTNDAHYFGSILAKEFLKLIVTPESISNLYDYKAWQYFTLRYLLAADDLTFISVWSPTFLIDLMEYLHENYEQLSSDINRGEISINNNEYNKDEHSLLLEPNPLRASVVLQACSGGDINCSLLWPILDTISCWHDATAKQFVPKLKNIFRMVYFQPKGLMATEGVVSIPLCDQNASILAINSGFFEFMDVSGNIYLAHELRKNETYCVIISNYSGLYRYKLGDYVKVIGFVEHAPLIEFVGRYGVTSDLCGEKLTEEFVQQQFNGLAGFMMLMPQSKIGRGYLLIVDDEQYSVSEAGDLAIEIDERLMKNPQYAYARKINQLNSLKVIRSKKPWKQYIEHEAARNRKIGDIKPRSLYADADFLKLIQTAC